MNSPDVHRSDRAGRLLLAAGFAWREFWASNPPGVLAVSLLPRAVLQALFFLLLGELVAGPQHREYVLVGTPVVTVPLVCTVAIGELVLTEKWSGTFWRIRLGRLHPALLFAVRAWPYAVVGFVVSIIALVTAGLAVGLGGSIPALLPYLPVYALLAVTCTVAGLAGAAAALGRRADVVVGNLLAYLIILGSGAFVATDRLGWAQPLTWLLPTTNGLAGIRDALAGRSWWNHLAAEVAVGVGWLLVAVVLISVQVLRARREGHDDFT